MATDEMTEDDPVTVRAGVEQARGKSALSRTAVLASGLIGLLLVAWFFFAWLALDHDVVDAAGESVGSAFAILVLVSLVGAFRRNRDRR
jgi:uncharacterized protein (TIGR03382 family)